MQPSSETSPAPTRQPATAAHPLWSLNTSPRHSRTPVACFHPLLQPVFPLFSLQILLCPPLSSAGPVPELLRAAEQADSTFCPKARSKLASSRKEGGRSPLADSKSRAPVPACTSEQMVEETSSLSPTRWKFAPLSSHHPAAALEAPGGIRCPRTTWRGI